MAAVADMTLAALDVLCHAAHLFIIGFNLLGWISPRTRRAHRWLVGATAFFWLAIGPVYGVVGYCPLTDGHWAVKRARGEAALPGSYIDYLLQGAGLHFDPAMIDGVVGGAFLAVCAVTLYLWRRERRVRSSAA